MQHETIPCLFSAKELQQRIGELADRISVDYRGKDVILIGVLKGAWVFLADLVRCLTIPVRSDFVKISSYGMADRSSGSVHLQLDMTIPAEGQELLLVEDIIDTGTTIPWLIDHLRQKRPAGIRVCALLDKPARRQTPVTIDYLGFSIPDLFVVGYGIDYAEKHRQLPYVGYIPSGLSDGASG